MVKKRITNNTDTTPVKVSKDVYDVIDTIAEEYFKKFGIKPEKKQIIDKALSDLYEKVVVKKKI